MSGAVKLNLVLGRRAIAEMPSTKTLPQSTPVGDTSEPIILPRQRAVIAITHATFAPQKFWWGLAFSLPPGFARRSAASGAPDPRFGRGSAALRGRLAACSGLEIRPPPTSRAASRSPTTNPASTHRAPGGGTAPLRGNPRGAL